jgi:hypothetical protein
VLSKKGLERSTHCNCVDNFTETLGLFSSLTLPQTSYIDEGIRLQRVKLHVAVGLLFSRADLQ